MVRYLTSAVSSSPKGSNSFFSGFSPSSRDGASTAVFVSTTYASPSMVSGSRILVLAQFAIFGKNLSNWVNSCSFFNIEHLDSAAKNRILTSFLRCNAQAIGRNSGRWYFGLLPPVFSPKSGYWPRQAFVLQALFTTVQGTVRTPDYLIMYTVQLHQFYLPFQSCWNGF